MPDERRGATRRELIAGALGAGGVALGYGAVATAATPPLTDASLLTAALEAEQLSVLAYRHVLTLHGLTAPVATVLDALLGHERAHVLALQRQLRAIRAPLPAAPASPAQVDQGLSQHGMSGNLAGLSTVHDALQLLLDVEAMCEGAYYTAIEHLVALGPLVSAVQALAADAQHSTLLSDLLHDGDIKQSVPGWYVAGVA